MPETVAVIGLGYVGLPVALAFARHFPDVLGFDISEKRVAELRVGRDRTAEVSEATLRGSAMTFTSDPEALRGRSFFVVAVPTPVDDANRPDLGALRAASSTVAKALTRGAVVVYESTVFPGATEEVCLPILETGSGLKAGMGFGIAYSPERINPGDVDHPVERITKVVAGGDPAALERVAAVYGQVIDAGIHRAPSIKVAETAKILENTQRDLNVALMNELAMICHRLGIRTADVLDAARTKWNFLPFTPGLVGGHCIGVDPYYLTAKAEQLGYRPEVILAGRRINDRIGEYVATELVRLLIEADVRVKGARIGILGLTFKENVPDLRNSKVIDIVRTLDRYGLQVLVHDPLASPEDAAREYGIVLSPIEHLVDLDGLVLAVSHRPYVDGGANLLSGRLRAPGVFMDVKSAIPPGTLSDDVHHWSL